MMHRCLVHLLWTGGQSAALYQQPKPIHNGPKDDYANVSQPGYFPRNRRRVLSRCNCSAVKWKNKQSCCFAGGRVFSLRTLLQWVEYINTYTHVYLWGIFLKHHRYCSIPFSRLSCWAALLPIKITPPTDWWHLSCPIKYTYKLINY